GCLAFGIGTSEVEHVLATQCLLTKQSIAMLVRDEGPLPVGCTSNDILLAVIGRIGTRGGTGYAIGFGGSTIRELSMEARIAIDKVFIGSCTNSRIEDLRAAAWVVQRLGKRVATNVKLALVVPGSGLVKAQAEAEGLDKIFKAAGFDWREPGCSMCLAMNDD